VRGRTSRHCRSVHVSHSCFVGFQHQLGSGSQRPVETRVLPFDQAIGTVSDPRITFPIFSKSMPASSGCVLRPLVSGRRRHRSLEGHQPRRETFHPSSTASAFPSNPRRARRSSIGAFRAPCSRRAGSSRKRPITFGSRNSRPWTETVFSLSLAQSSTGSR
jgi:hypothetical protein